MSIHIQIGSFLFRFFFTSMIEMIDESFARTEGNEGTYEAQKKKQHGTVYVYCIPMNLSFNVDLMTFKGW